MRINLVVRQAPKIHAVQVKKKEVKHPTKGKKLSVKARVLLCGALVPMVACGGFHASVCTTEGCRARNDYATGIISETRAPQGQKSAHYQLREQQAKQTWLGYFRDMFKGGSNE